MKHALRILAVVGCFWIASFTISAFSQEAYKFELMWPSLDQLWYFNFPSGVTINSSGHLYVVDSGNHRILKFDANGTLMTQWGSEGTGDGQFDDPWGIALDAEGNLYITDSVNNRVQKFDPDGRLTTKWGSLGTADNQFSSPYGVAIDSAGYVYVADSQNNRIQKFDSNGSFITKWGSRGSGDGQFLLPIGVAVDSAGHVYVSDANNCIQKFDSNGTFISKWGSQGSGDGQFESPAAVAVDALGIVYVADWYSIQKFNSNGTFITRWGSRGSEDGRFAGPTGVAADSSSGNVYVADNWNNRIQKFDLEGNFVTKWGSSGTEAAQFQFVRGVAIDFSGNAYVADSYRIQKFDSNGDLIEIWTSSGTEEGNLGNLQGLAVDLSGNVYVAQGKFSFYKYYSSFIKKFDSDGSFITMWGGSPGSGDGQFLLPTGVAVDSLSGNVYVADYGSARIQKFDPNGNFIAKWGSWGTAEGQVSHPHGVAVDSAGHVYVADTGNNRIQKFDSNGNFIVQWGSFGMGEGQFSRPEGVAVDSQGKVYVADAGNHRIQKFSPMFVPLENITTPNTPSGPTDVVSGTEYTYSTGGSTSDLGHPVEYRFYWGDGTDSDWSSSTDVSKIWLSLGTYKVKAKARCSIHTTIESDWSGTLTVLVRGLADLTGQWTAPLVQICTDTRNSKQCRVSGKMVIHNIGNLNSPPSFVRFYLSDNRVYDEGVDIFLRQVKTGTIEVGKSKTKTLNYRFPTGETASGKYVIAVIDAGNTIPEPNKDNNYVASEQIP